MRDSNIVNTKCPKCSSNDVLLDEKLGKLKCNYCGYTFENEKYVESISENKNLSGTNISSGARDLEKSDKKPLVVIQCSNCGAEVIINDGEEYGKCHWCHTILSSKEIIDRLRVPDQVLPFKIKKEEAKELINQLILEKKKYAKNEFLRDLNLDNIYGVYLPYMLVDVNYHCNFEGYGEHEISRSYNEDTCFYYVEKDKIKRKFNITSFNVMIDANSSRKSQKKKYNSYNEINAVSPFDVEKCVKYSPNYMVGYRSEKRDMNVNDLDEEFNDKIKKIATFAINDSVKYYNRGVCWEKRDVDVKGTNWSTAYLPLWIYSYCNKKNKKYYFAVNGRTGTTVGYVPVKKWLVFLITFLISLLVLSVSLITAAMFYTIIVEIINTFIFPNKVSNSIFSNILNIICVVSVAVTYIATFIYIYRYLYDGYSGRKSSNRYELYTRSEVSDMEGEDIKDKNFKTTKDYTNKANNRK